MWKLLLFYLALLALSACGPYSPQANSFGSGMSYTAPKPDTTDVVAAIRSEKYSGENLKLYPAPLLNCDELLICQIRGSKFESYVYDNENIYIWSYRYLINFKREASTFVVMISRPESRSYDTIGFEKVGDKWKVGIILKVNHRRWDIEDAGGDFPLAIGLSKEPWAVVVFPKATEDGQYTFGYMFVKDYWK